MKTNYPSNVAIKRRAGIDMQQPTKWQVQLAEQEKMKALNRADSCLDHDIPLCAMGPMVAGRPEYGADILTYYRAKAARREHGLFDPLYQLAFERPKAA